MTEHGKQERQTKTPDVPFGCKVLGWLYIIDALSIMFENGSEPAGVANIFKTVVCFVMITSALAMLTGHKVGLAAFSAALAAAGVTMLSAHYFRDAAITLRPVAVTLLYYFIPTIYLLSNWGVFSSVDMSKPNQK